MCTGFEVPLHKMLGKKKQRARPHWGCVVEWSFGFESSNGCEPLNIRDQVDQPDIRQYISVHFIHSSFKASSTSCSLNHPDKQPISIIPALKHTPENTYARIITRQHQCYFIHI